MRRVLVHLGYPKTGTTLLQRDVFRRVTRSAERHVIGMDPDGASGTPMSYLRFRRTLAGQRPDWFLPRPHWRDLAPEGWEHLILSDEGPLSSEIRRIIHGRRPGRFESRLEWLRERIPTGARASILLTTRAQGQLIPSLLAEMHHSLSPAARDLRRWVTMAEDPGSPLHALLDAERVLGRLTTTLGAAEAHLLPLELLATDPGEYGARLSRALGEPIEPPTGDRQNVRRIDRDEWVTSTTVGAGGIGRAVYRLYARRALPLPPRILLRRSPGDVPDRKSVV